MDYDRFGNKIIAGWQNPQNNAAFAAQDKFRQQTAPGIRGIDPNTKRMSGALPYSGPTAFGDERNASQFANMNQQPTRFNNILGFMPKVAPQGGGMGATASQGISPVKPDATPAPKVQSVSKPDTTVSKPPMAQPTPALQPMKNQPLIQVPYGPDALQSAFDAWKKFNINDYIIEEQYRPRFK